MNPTLVAVVSLVVTVLGYVAARKAHQAKPRPWLMPVLVVPTVLIAALAVAGVSYADYFHYTRWLLWLLGPTTIAFALPMFQQRQMFRRYPVSITIGVICGVSLGLLSSWLLGRLFNLSPELRQSMMLRSISTPFALQTAGVIGASADLTSLGVLLTGTFGIVLGEGVLLLVRPQTSFARGAMWGAASHAIGTAKAQQRNPEEGVISSLVMILSGSLMVLLAPWLAQWLR
jgi:putative effector of murein hydrolase